MEINRVLLGNCQKVLGNLPDNSVDLVVTDPPYGYSFMGKDWDKAVPKVAVWKECLRVLKPGAFAFVMSSPRADVLSHMIVNLSNAGFRTDFTPMFWSFASGFPKSCNISKAVDKRNGRQPEQYKELGEYLRVKRGVRPQKDIAQLFLSKTGGLTGCVANWELGLNIPTKEQWLSLKRELQLDSRFDTLIEREEAKREVIGKDGRTAKDSMFNIGVQPEWDITIPKTEEAKLLDGSYGGFQPKPAVEIIIVAMKPLSEKTFVDQALANGKGVTWLDNCRIPFQSQQDKDNAKIGFTDVGLSPEKGWNDHNMTRSPEDYDLSKGRFPANLLVSDDCLNDGKEHHASSGQVTDKTTSMFGFGVGFNSASKYEGDKGEFSRYFSLDAWFKKQFKKLPVEVQRTFPFLIEPKASKTERNRDCEELGGTKRFSSVGGVSGKMLPNKTANLESHKVTGNFHPTVKPLQLMSYLITLGSRPNDLVLDPFAGSGTTCLAAKMLGRQFLGVEIKKEYVALAEARVGNHRTLFEFTTPDITI
jgi:DNA modification methylase